MIDYDDMDERMPDDDALARRISELEAELHFKACLVRDLLPYQERAAKAEAERDALRTLLLNTRTSMVAVLCDHDERCCIDGTDADRAEIDNAIAAIDAALKEPRT